MDGDNPFADLEIDDLPQRDRPAFRAPLAAEQFARIPPGQPDRLEKGLFKFFAGEPAFHQILQRRCIEALKDSLPHLGQEDDLRPAAGLPQTPGRVDAGHPLHLDIQIEDIRIPGGILQRKQQRFRARKTGGAYLNPMLLGKPFDPTGILCEDLRVVITKQDLQQPDPPFFSVTILSQNRAETQSPFDKT